MVDSLLSGNWKYSRAIYVALAMVAAMQVFLIYLLSPITQQFIVRLSILIPEVLIWLIAARGARRFKNYAYSIRDSADGAAMNMLANGLLLLVVYIVALVVASTCLDMLRDTQFAKPVTAIGNHLPLLIALVASVWLYVGTKKLVALVEKPYWTTRRIIYVLVPYAAVAVFFCIDFYRMAPKLVTATGEPRYVLPVQVLVVSYVIPHLLVWLLGIISGVNLAVYARTVAGNVYKRLFRNVYRGILLVYLCIFFAQLVMVSPIVVSRFSVGLFFIYATLVLAIVGFTLLFRGAVQLQRIEEPS